MSNDINLSDSFWGAVDEIVTTRLNGISYDLTILCTIVDDSKREQGIYTVSDGSTKFKAYSEKIDYRKHENVYVQIPSGDWNQQKFIIGKKLKDDQKQQGLTYRNPFSELIDITGNLIGQKIEAQGLVANKSSNKESLESGKPGSSQQVIWEYLPTNRKVTTDDLKDGRIITQGENLFNYTRLGLQASFKSLLNPCVIDKLEVDGDLTSKTIEISKGNYGLKLRLKVEKEDTITSQKNETSNDENLTEDQINKTEIVEILLDVNAMNGNPYEFNTFYEQEIVVDISEYKKVIGMELVFFQDGKFTDNLGEFCPWTDWFNSYTQADGQEMVSYLPPNLFVQDFYISLGYDASDFNEETAIIYTPNSLTYSAKKEPFYDNHKEVQLRWIYKDGDNIISVNEGTQNLNYEVRWYRYSLGAASADDYSGMYWKLLSTQRKEKGKWIYEINDPDWKDYNKSPEEEEIDGILTQITRQPSFFKSWIIPSMALFTEQIKAIIFLKDGNNNITRVVRSNSIQFSNENEVVSRPTVDSLEALTIGCEDKTYGNYLIYNEGNRLINNAESAIE